MDIILSFTSGILAAFSPCVAVLIPLIFYRMMNQKTFWQDILRFSVAFLVVFLIMASGLTLVMDSLLRNGFRLGLGILLVALGILDLLGKTKAMHFPILKNTYLLGGVAAVVMSINPCSFAYIAFIISKSSQLVVDLLAFGVGMLAPAIAFVIFGDRVLRLIRVSGRFTHYLSKAMSVLLIGIGVYLGVTITSFEVYDAILAGVILAGVFVLMMRMVWDRFSPSRIGLLVALLLITFAVTYHCAGFHADSELSEYESLAVDPGQVTCQNAEYCEICSRCLVIFSSALIIGGLSILGHELYERKH